MDGGIITESTLVPIGAVASALVSIVGFVFWLTKTYVLAKQTAKDTHEIRVKQDSIEQVLSQVRQNEKDIAELRVELNVMKRQQSTFERDLASIQTKLDIIIKKLDL